MEVTSNGGSIMAVKEKFEFGVAPFIDETKKREVKIPYPATLAGVNYTRNPELWSYYPSFSIWSGKEMNGEIFNDPGIVDKLHQSFQLGLHSSAGIPKDPIAIDNGHASYKDMPQSAWGYIIDTAVVKGEEVIDIIQGEESSRKSPVDTRVLMLLIGWLPSGLQAIASGSAPSISISMDTFENGNVILRQPGLVIRPADNWLPKLAAFEEKEVIKLAEETKTFMDANSAVMQAWMELLAGMDEAMGQELLDKVKTLVGGETPEMEQKTEPFAVQTALTKEDVQAMINTALSGITAQPVAAMPEPIVPTEGMLTARFESADLPFDIAEKLENKCKDFDKETAKTFVANFKANHNPPKAGHDLPEPDVDINKVPASVMVWK